MSITSETLRKLADLRLAPDQMAGVLDILADMSSADEARRGAQRDRTRRHREAKRDGNVTVTDEQRDSDVTPLPSPDKRKEPKENYPLPTPVSNKPARETTSRSELAAEFDRFWAVYPLKAGKGHAEKAFAKARKLVSLEAILAGARRYAEERRLQDRTFTKHPATWLNAKGWEDEPAPPPVAQLARGSPPPRPRRPGDEFADMLAGRNRPDPQPQTHRNERTIDGFAERR